SADASALSLRVTIEAIVAGIGGLLESRPERAALDEPGAAADRSRVGPPFPGRHPGSIEVDDSFVGEGYGVPTAASREAIELAARCEAIFLDPTYTAKAMAGLIAYVRERRFNESQTVLFWHTGGQVGLFA